MAEIKTQVRKLREGSTHKAGPDEYIITDEHTIADILRWLAKQAGGKDQLAAELAALRAGGR